MSQRKDTKLSQFQQEAKNVIRKLRKSGLEDSDISKLFEEALRERQTRGRCVGCLCLWSIRICVLLVVVFLLFTISINYKPTEYYIDRYTHHLAYPVLRGLRLLTLPFSTRFDLTALYYKDCLLENPLFQPDTECWPCEDVKEVQILDNVDNFQSNYYHQAYPFVWKNAVPHDVSIKDLLQLLDENFSLFQSIMKVEASSNTSISSVRELLDKQGREELEEDKNMNILWKIRGSGGLKLIRDLSWKPSFIPENIELNPAMFIQISGTEAVGKHVPKADLHPNAWITQAQGEGKVILSPVPHCQKNCTSFEVAVSEKDVLFFNADYWRCSTIPSGSQLNLQFISSFY